MTAGGIGAELPSSPDAERALLGAILLDPAKLELVAGFRSEDFSDPRNARIFAAVRRLAADGRPGELVTLVSYLKDSGQLDSAGGPAYVSSLPDGIPRINQASEWARIVSEKARLRHIAKAAESAQSLALAGDEAGALRVLEAARQAGAIAHSRTVWDSAEGLESFLESGEDGPQFLDEAKRIIARASVTEIFSPRGLGKSLYALWLAIRLAGSGSRVLFLDRDNPRHVVRSRLRSFGVDGGLPSLKVLSREKCPPLTNTAAWAAFPYADYDAVFLDSLDSATEGVGEQDSSKPSRAIAPLLDVARRENGPGVLVLGNTVRTGKHSRCSGVIEDRADIVFEVRDATGFHPIGPTPWHEQLPPADAGAWASRASRRKGRTTFRLGFIATKFRIGEEPQPFAVELDLSADPWQVQDVTAEIDTEGEAIRKEKAKKRSEALATAADSLAVEIARRAAAGEPPMLKDRDAIPFLVSHKLSRADAREVVNRPDARWTIARPEGQKGHPMVLLPIGRDESGGGNAPFAEPAKTQGIGDAYFRRARPERAAEIHPSKPQHFRGSRKPAVSADTPVSTSLEGTKSVLKGKL